MKTLLFSILIITASSCDPHNLTYSTVLSWDVYESTTRFDGSLNPTIGKTKSAPLFDIITDKNKCFIRLDENLISFQPKVNVYSVRATENDEPIAYFIVTRGTTSNPVDLHNDNLIALGYIPNYASTLLRYLKPKLAGWEGKELIFTGHSLGAFVAHSVGFVLDKFSIGFESPGTKGHVKQMEELSGDGRSYIDYHTTKTAAVTGAPNFINYLLERVEWNHLVIFVPPLTSCAHFINFITFSRFTYQHMLETPGWTSHYHSSDLIVDTLIENKQNLSAVMVDGLTFKLRPMSADDHMNEQFKAIYECITKYTSEKRSFEEVKAVLMNEIDDKWEPKVINYIE